MKKLLALVTLIMLVSCGNNQSAVGPQGAKGARGEKGATGASALAVWLIANPTKTATDFYASIKGSTGATGLSAYEFWKTTLPVGADNSPAAYIAALKGASALESWLAANPGKNEEDFYASIKGSTGETGLSAYEYWKTTLPVGADNSPEAYLAAIKGATGDNGALSKLQTVSNLLPLLETNGSFNTVPAECSDPNGCTVVTNYKTKEVTIDSKFFITQSTELLSQAEVVRNTTSPKAIVYETVAVNGPSEDPSLNTDFEPTYVKTAYFVDFSGLNMANISANQLLDFVHNNGIVVTQQSYGTQPGNYFTDTQGNYYLSEDAQSTKDVESIGSKIESKAVESVKEGLLSFGLSVERTEKLSKLLVSYKQIANKRALTPVERDQFTNELLGMNFENAAKKMVDNYEGLIQNAADRNGTSPEAIKELISDFMTK